MNRDRDTLLRLATLLDGMANMRGPLGAEQRARIFNVVEANDWPSWLDARSILITEAHTLWFYVIASGVPSSSKPTASQILDALEYALVAN